MNKDVDIARTELRSAGMERLLVIAALGIVAVFLRRAIYVAHLQFAAPFDLFFETPNLSTIKLIESGANPYDPAVYARLPFVLTMYTPLYHYLVALLPASDSNPFFIGRLVSAMSTALVGLCLYFVDAKRRNVVLATLAFAVFLTFWPVSTVTAYIKNDVLGICLSALAMVVAANARGRAPVVVCALLCVLSVATKQTYISAGVAGFFYFLTRDRRLCVTYLIGGVVFSCAFLVIAVFVWGRGFWFCTMSAPTQPFDLEHGLSVLGQVAAQPLFCLLVVVTVLLVVRQVRGSGKKYFRESPYLVYMVISTIVLTITVGKMGSATNYFIEVIVAQLLWIVYALRQEPSRFYLQMRPVLVCGVLVICCVYEMSFVNWRSYAMVSAESAEQRMVRHEKIREDIASIGIEHPIVLNLFSHQENYSITDRVYLNDPNLYFFLWTNGVLDDEPMHAAIGERYFDIIMVPKKLFLPKALTPDRDLSPPYRRIRDGVFAHYQIARTSSGFYYYTRQAISTE